MTLTIGGPKQLALTTAGTGDNALAAHTNFGTQTGVVVASNPAATSDGPASNAFDGSTYTYWTPDTTGVTDVKLRITTLTGVDVDFVAIASHNLGDYGATVEVDYSANGGANWTTVGAQASATDNRAMGWWFNSTNAPDWRIRVQGFTAGDPIAIGVVMFSKALHFDDKQFGGVQPPIASNEVDLLNNSSVGAHDLGNTVVRRGVKFPFTMDLLSESFTRGADCQAFIEAYNTGAGFFFAWSPTQYGDDLRFCRRDGAALAPVYTGVRARMALNMMLRAFGE
ncbi:MAG: discoidin domain-containing protein [Pikeienuella sp.]